MPDTAAALSVAERAEWRGSTGTAMGQAMVAGKRLWVIGGALALAAFTTSLSIARTPDAQLLALVAGFIGASLLLLPIAREEGASGRQEGSSTAEAVPARELLNAIDHPMLIIRDQ